jgi:pimeloyl-ACP methyl ester carboxylesterase
MKPAPFAAIILMLFAGCGSAGTTGQPPEDPSGGDLASAYLGHCKRLPAIDGFKCGSIDVPKYRSAPELGSFKIGFAVRPRNDKRPSSQGVIFAVEGGPGYSSTGTANAYTKVFGPLLDHHELVLVDMRGTGLSEPIDCPDVQRGTAPEWISLGQCAARLGDDFEAYNTGAAADDIDAVREVLGYDKISLYGDSYGTYLSQSYAFRFPDNLDAVVLDSAYPVRGENPWYPSLIKSGNRDFVAACNRSPSCPPGAAERLDQQAAYMRDRGMNPGVLVDAIADAAYGPPESYLKVERAGRELMAGNSKPWIELTNDLKTSNGDVTQYDHADELAVGCNDYPMIWDKDASEEERRGQLEDAIRNYDPDAFAPFTPREVAIGSVSGYNECLTWPKPTDLRESPLPAGATPTDAPVLIINGEFDDLTTTHEGALVAKQFPNSQRFIGRNAGHVDALYNADGPSAKQIRRFLRSTWAAEGN